MVWSNNEDVGNGVRDTHYSPVPHLQLFVLVCKLAGLNQHLALPFSCEPGRLGWSYSLTRNRGSAGMRPIIPASGSDYVVEDLTQLIPAGRQANNGGASGYHISISRSSLQT
jgi:hypothetical protein